MRYGLMLGVKVGNVSKEFLIQVFENLVKFQPITFTVKNRTWPWDNVKFYKALEKFTEEHYHAVSDNGGNGLYAGKAGIGTKHYRIKLAQNTALIVPTQQELQNLIRDLLGFVYMYAYHADYVEVQSELYESMLTNKQYPVEIISTIKNTPVRRFLADNEIDTRFNPGRTVLIGRLTLLAAWKMWLGEPFFEFVSKDRVISFPHAFKIEEMESGIIFVQLFERMEDSYTPDGMFRQWKWQEWIDFDGIFENFFRK